MNPVIQYAKSWQESIVRTRSLLNRLEALTAQPMPMTEEHVQNMKSIALLLKGAEQILDREYMSTQL